MRLAAPKGGPSGAADQHLAAAETAMQNGDEQKCMEEVEAARQFIRMERQHHNRNWRAKPLA